jgi:DUF1680 family protein
VHEKMKIFDTTLNYVGRRKMKLYAKIILLVLLALLLSQHALFAKDRGITNTTKSPNVKQRSVDIDDVKWTKGFWADKFKTAHEVMIPNIWRILKDPDISHAWHNFLIVAGMEEGEFKGTPWYDGDVYKSLESAAYVYAITKDKALDRLMDEAIEVIGKAQDEDGYITTFVQIGKGQWTWGEGGESPYLPFSGETRWQDLHRHELYNMGHLLTAGCIHYRATGKKTLLNIARKTGDYLYEVFKTCDPKLAHFGFNPSNIMGSVELYRTTGDPKYLELAGIFVDMRGSQPGGEDQNQTRTPLIEETEAVGHAVTAAYLYAGAADVYAETGEKALWDALERIWRNVVYQKMYITGGTCAIHIGVTSSGDKSHEAFGREYELPHLSAYNETCANIANGMWNWRMLGITGEVRFADVLETVLYNSGISGISIDGKLFCYTNNLRWYGNDSKLLKNDTYTRLPYLGCFCCPPNVVRTIAKVGGWAYGVSNEAVWVNLYGSNELNTELPDGSQIMLKQETDYPWDGNIQILVNSPKKKEYALMLRIPQWAAGATIKVNGKKTEAQVEPGQYSRLSRVWNKGDIVELDLQMRARLIRAHPLVEEARNQVAVQRGPVVYCLESHDLPGSVNILDVFVPQDLQLTPRYDKSFLGGVVVLEGRTTAYKQGMWTDKLYAELTPPEKQEIDLKLIPYYAWNNRGAAHMTVWFPLAYY